MPTQPNGLSIVNATGGPVLTWNGVAGVTSYTIQRSADAYANYSTVGSAATETFTDTSATAGVPAYYRILAVDGTGSSAPSDSRVGARLAAVGADPVAVTALNLYPTFHSIDVELRYTGDADRSAIARVEYKQSGQATWRHGLPIWPVFDQTDATYFAHIGSLLFLAPGTSYDVRITIADSGGVTGLTAGVMSGNVTTMAEAIPAASTLTPTHYVSPTGSDANAGTSSGAPWATAGKAFTAANNATADMVIQFAPGYYVRSTSQIVGNGHRITLKAQYPAVDDNGGIINAGQHSVLEPSRGSRPTGSAATGDNTGLIEGPWVLVDGTIINGYTVPNGSNVYMWAGCPIAFAAQMGYASTRAGAPRRLAKWGIGSITSDGGYINFMLTADMYRFGWFVSPTASSTVYLRLPATAGTTDPNALYITIGSNVAIDLGGTSTPLTLVNGAVHRVSGFEVRTCSDGIRVSNWSDHCVVDHNYAVGSLNNINLAADSTTGRGADTPVIQYNILQDFNLRAGLGQASDPTTGLIPWSFIKAPTTGTAASQGSITNGRSGQDSETNGIYGNRGALRPIVRYNVMDGVFNGISGYNRVNRNAMGGMDIYRNIFQNINDDCHENEASAFWWKIWDNQHINCLVWLSTAPCQTGPVYMLCNRVWQHNMTNVPDNTVLTIDGSQGPIRKGGAGMACKMTGSATVNPHIYMHHNTVWTNYGADASIDGQVLDTRIWSTAGGGVNRGVWNVRNNLFRVGHRTDAGEVIGEDYNIHAVAGVKTGAGLQWSNGSVYRTAADFANYRTVSGNGTHSNFFGGVTRGVLEMAALLDAELVNPSAGDTSLLGTSTLLTAGTPLPMSSPGYSTPRIGYVTPTIDGEAPPVGPPAAPSGLIATAVSNTRIDLSWTDNATDESRYVVEQSANGTTGWTVIGVTGANVTTFIVNGLSAGTAYYFRVRANRDVAP